MADTVKIRAGLDLGSTKIAIALASQQGKQPPQLIGFSQQSCRFLRNGSIINLEAAQKAVKQILEEIHSLCRTPVHEILVNIPPGNIKHDCAAEAIELRKRREIVHRDVADLLRSMMEEVTDGWETVNLLPYGYTVDGQPGITSPIGMMAETLEIEAERISISSQSFDNLNHSVRKFGFTVDSFLPDIMAHAESILTPDERELGVWIVDLGGSYTQMAAIHGERLTLLPTLNLGGDQITSDIAIGLRTPIRDAERIKTEFGAAIARPGDDELKIEIQPLGGAQTKRYVTSHLLTEIIRPRIDEIFSICVGAFRKNLKPERCSAGVILVGGGALLKGCLEVAEKHFQMPVMTAHIRDVTGLTDLAPPQISSTAIGLALYGLRRSSLRSYGFSKVFSFHDLFKRLIHWFGGG